MGSLPKYFNKDEFDVRVMIPKYTAIPEEYKNQMQYLTHFYLELEMCIRDRAIVWNRRI